MVHGNVDAPINRVNRKWIPDEQWRHAMNHTPVHADGGYWIFNPQAQLVWQPEQ
jgi:hypothetical protein